MPTEVIFTSSVLSMSSGLSSAAWTQPESKLSCIVLLAPWRAEKICRASRMSPMSAPSVMISL